MTLYVRLEAQDETLPLEPQIAATSTLEYCSYAAGAFVGCTPFYPSPAFPQLAPTEDRLQESIRANSYTGRIDDVFALWSGSVGHYLRVNGGSPNVIDDLRANGACVEPKELASVGDFVVWGMESGMDPFGAAGFDVCTMSSAERLPGFGRWQPNLCITADQANYLGVMLSGVDEAMTNRLQGNPEMFSSAIVVGKNGAGNLQSHIIVLPNWAGGGTGGPSDFRITPGGLQCVDPTKDMRQVSVAGGACGGGGHHVVASTLNLSTHEWAHVFQSKWEKKYPHKASVMVPDGGVAEGQAKSVEAILCSFFFGAETQICNSAFDIAGRGSRGIYESTMLLRAPETDVVEPPYESSIFWNYMYEQYSYPVGSSAHPSGTASILPRECKLGASCPADATAEFGHRGRESDEGADFVGLFFDEAARGPTGDTFHAALDRTLRKNLGRSLDDVAFDFQTALYLKDYENPEPRFRLEWVQWEDNGFFPNPDQAPLRSQFTDFGSLYNVQRFDGLFRRFRELDSRGACTPAQPGWFLDGCKVCCSPTLAAPDCTSEPPCDTATGRVSLHTDSTLAGVTGVGARGGTAVSIHTAPDLVGHSVAIHVGAEFGNVRLRAYRIQRGASGKFFWPVSLTPDPLCQGDECTFSLRASDVDDTSGSVTLFASVDADTDEILVIAGSDGASSRFNWAFSDGNEPDLRIVEPTQSLPAFVGHPNGPEGVLPALVKLQLSDTLGNAIDVSKDDLAFEVPGCAKPTCAVPADSVEVVSGLSGGHALVVLRIPDDFFPPAPAEVRLPLEVTTHGAFARRDNAILTVETTRKQSTMLVFDMSGSMNDDFKVDGARNVAKALVRAMVPVGGGSGCEAADTCPNSVGLVTFSNDASTQLAPNVVHADNLALLELVLDGATASPSGNTSIGDGVLESQSALAAAYDNAATRPDQQTMIVLSDGLNNENHQPNRYYNGAFAGDVGDPPRDGDCPTCAPWELRVARSKRLEVGLPVPIVSTIALGQDADLKDMQLLARFGGGTTIYVSDPQSTEAAVTMELAEGAFGALDAAQGMNRVASKKSRGGDDLEGLLFVPVEPGTKQLRLSVVSTRVNGALAQVVRPTSPPTQLSPTAVSADGRQAVYVLQNPEPGPWFAFTASAPGEPTVFFDAAVRGGSKLFAFADVDDIVDPAGPVDDPDIHALVGSDVALRAMMYRQAPAKGCLMGATVKTPGGQEHVFSLTDDGVAADATRDDGIYSAKFAATSETGTYQVKYGAICPDATLPIVREATSAFFVECRGDADSDQLCDSWERRVGLDPANGGDAILDEDGDGLDGPGEFASGTDPKRADTDGGGETDGAEAAGGTNPRDPRDDRVDRPVLSATPCSGAVVLGFGMDTTGARLTVEKAATPAGPFTLVTTTAGLGTLTYTDPAPDHVQVCYRSRLTELTGVPGVASGWSPVQCTTPAEDALPPVVHLTAPAGAACTSAAAITIEATDPLDGSDAQATVPAGCGQKASGVTEMRIAKDPTFADVPFVPYARTQTISSGFGGSVWVQVRDAAGNLSEPAMVALARGDGAWPAFRATSNRQGRALCSGPGGSSLLFAYDTSNDVRSSPAIGPDGTIYFGSHDHKLRALRPDGSVLWTFQTGGWVSSSAALSKDFTRVYVGSHDDKLYALNAGTGAQVWSVNLGNLDVESSPVVSSDGTIYVGGDSDRVYAVSPAGAIVWSYKTGADIDSSPAIGADGTVFVGSDDDYVYAIRANGTLKWRYKTGGDVDSTPAVSSDGAAIYVGSDDDKLYKLNAATGAKIWSYDATRDVDASPAIASDGTIVFGSDSNEVVALNPITGVKKWKFSTGGDIKSSPAIGSDDIVYVGSDDERLYALRVSNGSLVWSYKTDGSIKSSPAVGADGRIYVGSNDEKLYAFGPDDIGSTSQPLEAAEAEAEAGGDDGEVSCRASGGRPGSSGNLAWPLAGLALLSLRRLQRRSPAGERMPRWRQAPGEVPRVPGRVPGRATCRTGDSGAGS